MWCHARAEDGALLLMRPLPHPKTFHTWRGKNKKVQCGMAKTPSGLFAGGKPKAVQVLGEPGVSVSAIVIFIFGKIV